MKKALAHFIILAGIFLTSWFLLSNIPFVEATGADKVGAQTEKKLGTLLLENVLRQNKEIKADSVRAAVRDIKDKLCKGSGIDPKSIEILVVDRGDVNAFTLPDRKIIVLSGLIRYCDNAEELTGVIAHELAHAEKGHVMKKLSKEVGITLLGTIAGGQSGGGVVTQISKKLASSGFDRDYEREADTGAVAMMKRVHVNPEYLADFLFRLSQGKDTFIDLSWISTHPDSKERCDEILKLCKNDIRSQYKPVLSKEEWNGMLDVLNRYEE